MKNLLLLKSIFHIYLKNIIEVPHSSAADDFLDRMVGDLLSIQLTLVFK